VKSDHFVGSDSFVEQTKQQAGQNGRSLPRNLRRLSGLEDLIAIVESLGGPDRERLASESRQTDLNRWRLAVAYVGRRFYRFTVLKIGLVLGRDPTSVSHMLSRVRDKEEMIPEIARLLEKLDTRTT
jgi:chromosomal replication initiation ATPase DnaA